MVYAIDSLENSTISNFAEYVSGAKKPNSVLEQSTSSSPSRSGMRRMRTETTTPYLIEDTTTTTDRTSTPSDWTVPTIQKDFEPIEALIEQINAALLEGQYEKGLPLVNVIDAIWNGALLNKVIAYLEELGPEMQSSHVRPAIEFLGNSVLAQMKAFFLALSNDSDAIALCNSGFENLRLGVAEVLALAKEQQWDSPNAEKEVQEYVDMAEHLMRGMLAMAMNLREMAIDDLRAGFSAFMAEDLSDLDYDLEDFDIGSYFTIKAFEQKLQASLLPQSPIVDDQNPQSLFLAGRYEEALSLLSMPKFSNQDVEGFRAASLALMGRHDEAFEILDGVDYSSRLDASMGIPLILFLKGDYEAARQMAFEPEHGNISFGYLLLLAEGCK